MEMELYGHLSFSDLDTWGLTGHKVQHSQSPSSKAAHCSQGVPEKTPTQSYCTKFNNMWNGCSVTALNFHKNPWSGSRDIGEKVL
jgi:hypothetical protein